MASSRLRRAVLFAAFSVLAACGHSGGGDPAPALSAGPFHSIGFKAIHGSPDTLTTNVGTVVSNGVTLTDAGSTQNENGAVTADPGGPVVPFSVTPAGVLSLTDGLGTENFRGGVILGGDMAAVAAVLPFFPSESALVLTVKKGSGLSDATLSGDYHSAYFGAFAFVGGTHFGILGTAAFNGAGVVTLGATLSNQDGVISTVPSSGLGTYGVAADGTFTLGPDYQGGASAAGDFAVAGGGVTSGSLNVTWVFVRKAAFADPGSLTGNYTIVGIGYSLANARYYDFTGLFTADGDGHCTVTLTSSEEGVISTTTDSSTYTVAADGTLVWTFGIGATTFKGAVSQDGRIGFVGGGSSTGSDPTLAVLLRR